MLILIMRVNKVMKCSLCEQTLWNSLLQIGGFALINVQIHKWSGIVAFAVVVVAVVVIVVVAVVVVIAVVVAVVVLVVVVVMVLLL